MATLPNPFEFAGCVEPIPASSAVASSLQPPSGDATASPFNDEPLPLFLTEPNDEIDRGMEAILRVIFGVHDRRGMV